MPRYAERHHPGSSGLRAGLARAARQHSEPSRRCRRATLVAALSLACAGAVGPSWAEDSAEVRYYFDFRYEDVASGLTKAHDGAGLSIGANLNRYVGLEFSLDAYDIKVGDVSELEVLGFVPQGRLRYPLLDDRLVPYVVGGAGLAVTQANDARAKVHWPGGKTGVHPAGTLGGGIEYFVADNVAFSLEGKYLFSGDVAYTTTTAGKHSLNVSSALVGVGVRVLYPELHPEKNAEAARGQTARFYLGLRTGAALLVNLEPFPGVHATPEQSIAGSNFTPLFGAALGVDIGRYAAVELALSNYELKLGVSGVGGIGEYSVFPIAVQPRFRYPLLDGRLEPYVAAGVGAEFAELNDRSTQEQSLMVKSKDITPIGTFVAGIDYFVMTNVSLGCAAQYTISRGHTLQFDGGASLAGNFDSFFLSVDLRVLVFGV
jgi:opacity protein-like surface antigen